MPASLYSGAVECKGRRVCALRDKSTFDRARHRAPDVNNLRAMARVNAPGREVTAGAPIKGDEGVLQARSAPPCGQSVLTICQPLSILSVWREAGRSRRGFVLLELAVERTHGDAEDGRGPFPVAVRPFEDMQDVLPLKLLKRLGRLAHPEDVGVGR